MKPNLLFDSFKKYEIEFFTGVPDSLLKDFCAYISDHTTNREHVITANEGSAVALASGYSIATNKIPLVYLQNSGLGNTINPLMSLADKEVYSIPMIVMIGWRGEPGVKDEPQHVKQGRIQNKLLDAIEVPYKILDGNLTDYDDFVGSVVEMAKINCGPVAIVVRGDCFEPYKLKNNKISHFEMVREDAVHEILRNLDDSEIVVSTTGKTSREVFEYRVRNGQGNQNDFLTVGSMGHTCQIALGIALFSNKKIICLDGDGSVIMHLGSLTVVGTSHAKNLIHIVLNNGAHDSVGGQPTVGFEIDLVKIAEACGYTIAISVDVKRDIGPVLDRLKKTEGPTFLEIKINKGARADLGRPTTTPLNNKLALMEILKNDR